ncbi:hypothetical protein [Pedobacter heparinus]|uniref:Uncharacterized protein n=1 Tax=Pedobacter heparinus (strain ATCC 13125 / DSM 2366 / CIP 104194 / JCM 7457 / NBRC 12017 / NCIMB 9290 / NRRL B-14731 / HIM 762-3) TaxID=485917 RepID=C6XWS2_PEDHD|nr:hypothetical protein [Pedobacter heparinus]ACU04216.1 hypothetical protein Phep_2011 [Pedobacter heparinus DSM 2366]
MKKFYYLLIIVAVLSSLPVLYLTIRYALKQRAATYNFKRNLLGVVKGHKAIDIKYNSYYIAGEAGSSVYLASGTAIGHLLKVGPLLKDTVSINLELNRQEVKVKGSYKAYVDSSSFYLYNGLERSILKGSTGIWKASVYAVKAPYFAQLQPLGTQTMVFRFIDTDTRANSLRKVNVRGESKSNTGIFEKQVDGLFCTDGMLRYNRQLHMLTYVYHYRNEILLIDTNLNLVKKIKTIDPIDSARFKVDQLRSEKSFTFASPSLMVNANCSNQGRYLFVQSKLMGKGEDLTLFRKSAAIDVYDLEKQVYCYSFYLPKYKEVPISSFKVLGNSLYAVAGQYLTRYALELPE